MLLELYVIYEVVMLGFFITAFFIKNEILWSISSVLSGALMFSSFSVDINTYIFNATIGAYSPVTITQHYQYLVWINGLFFVLSLVLGLFDLFDKYGGNLFKRKEDKEEE